MCNDINEDALDVVFAFMQFWSFWRGVNHDLRDVRCSENHRTNRLLNSDGQCKLARCFFNKRGYKAIYTHFFCLDSVSLTSKCSNY